MSSNVLLVNSEINETVVRSIYFSSHQMTETYFPHIVLQADQSPFLGMRGGIQGFSKLELEVRMILKSEADLNLFHVFNVLRTMKLF